MRCFFVALFFVLCHFSLSARVFVVPHQGIPGHIPLDPSKRPSQFPLISGDTFRNIADHIIDETRIPFETDDVKELDIIFVGNTYYEFFMKEIRPYIHKRYILLTHGAGDYNCPGSVENCLEDENIVVWFTREVNKLHPKIVVLPLGMPDWFGRHNDRFSYLKELRKNSPRMPKKYLLYINFVEQTNMTIRAPVKKYFQDKSFAYISPVLYKPYKEYVYDIAQSYFVACPRGTLEDSFRIWETLFIGAIPIIKHSTHDVLFEDLPVLLIDDWSQITEDFLKKKYREIKEKSYNFEKTEASYWIKKIKDCQKKYCDSAVIAAN